MAALADALVAMGAGGFAGHGGRHGAWGASAASSGGWIAALFGTPCPASPFLMNRTRLAIAWLLSSAAIAAFTAFAVLRWHLHHEHPAGGDLVPSEERFHHWVHENLSISPEQDAALHAAEASFASRRQELRRQLADASRELRTAIVRDAALSPSVDQAIQRLSASQAELQKALLGHLFTMAQRLEPGQRERLLQWTHDSLQPVP